MGTGEAKTVIAELRSPHVTIAAAMVTGATLAMIA